MVILCGRLEKAHGLDDGSLRFEVQIETPQAILGADGTATVAHLITAAQGRCCGLHYGTYDYSASVGIAAEYQSLEHPAADHAKAVLQVAAAGTGVRLSDGSTNVLPVGDTAAVRAAWDLHSRLVRRSLERGYYQGWDLHPAQLPTRFGATYAFFREAAPMAVERLGRYLSRRSAGILDEPATAGRYGRVPPARPGLRCTRPGRGGVRALHIGGICDPAVPASGVAGRGAAGLRTHPRRPHRGHRPVPERRRRPGRSGPAPRLGRHTRARQRARPHRVGRLRHGHSGRCCRRRDHAGGHAAQLDTAHSGRRVT